VRATFSVTGGSTALVVSASLVPIKRPAKPRVKVLVNQVGYEPDASKTAIVATSHFPARLEDARFAVVDSSGSAVFRNRLVPLGRVHEGQADDWGSYFWLADFSALSKAGRFRVKARVGAQSAASHPFSIRRGVLFEETAELAYRFLYYQRCGCAVPGWHEACHLDDARLPDGTHLNLAGGWHDAGDYNKWMYPSGPPLVLYGLASAYLAHRNYFDAIDRDGNGRADLLEEILWGADWMMRMRNPKTGGLFGSISMGWSYWGLAERETDNIPGNEDDRPVSPEEPSAALAAAALAKAAQCAADGESYARVAIELEAYVRKRQGTNADRLLACLAIWQATGQGEYLEQARACADWVAGLSPDGRQDRALAALALFVTNVPEARGDEKYRRALEDSVAWLSRRQGEEPFPLAANPPAGGQRDMEEPSRLSGMGNHMALTGNAWAALACARALGSEPAAQTAYTELDWLFGLNPLDLCMLEGVGSFNPPRYHHRYFDNPDHRDGAVPGAIPNGISRPNRQPALDLPFFDWVHRDAMTAEPWIPYNGYYLSAVSLMDAGM
jgi:endoglucanase